MLSTGPGIPRKSLLDGLVVEFAFHTSATITVASSAPNVPFMQALTYTRRATKIREIDEAIHMTALIVLTVLAARYSGVTAVVILSVKAKSRV